MKLPESLKTVTSTSKIAAVIFFGAFSLSAFYTGIWYQRNQETSNTNPALVLSPTEATPTATPTLVPTIVSSADKTFTNSTYKFSFKYPDNLHAGQLHFGENQDDVVVIGTQKQADFFNNATGGFGGSIKQAYLSLSVSPDEGLPRYGTNDSSFSVVSKPVTVGGVKGTEYTIKEVKIPEGIYYLEVGEQFRSTTIIKNGKIYDFTVYDKDNNYDAANKIINSFQFK